MTDTQTSTETTSEQPFFAIERLYVKDISLEMPHAPEIFQSNEQPKVDIQFNTINRQLTPHHFESSIKVNVKATFESDNKVLFIAEVTQSGLFQISRFPEADIETILGITCPNILFPFAREALAHVVGRTSLPPVYLSPVNFELLFEQQQAEAKAAAEATKN
jgi:preprotein translocase subunit SecB